MIRCDVPYRRGDVKATGDTSILETFVATNVEPRVLPESASASAATRLSPDWENVPKPQFLLLKFPGTAGRAERSSPFPANLIDGQDQVREPGQHHETWTWNPPGYGRSSGRPRLRTMASAAKCFASQVLAARAGSQTTVWICGNSLGCLAALFLASRLQDWATEHVDANRFALWLRNPPQLDEVVLKVADRYAARRLMRVATKRIPDSLDAEACARQTSLPAVFLMSEHDELVLPPIQRRIHNAYACEHLVVTLHGLGHGGVLEEEHRESVEQAVEWLVR
ncbi:MAG: alpha/beta fold hydrolase [Rhodopirellula sp. JB053]